MAKNEGFLKNIWVQFHLGSPSGIILWSIGLLFITWLATVINIIPNNIPYVGTMDEVFIVIASLFAWYKLVKHFKNSNKHGWKIGHFFTFESVTGLLFAGVASAYFFARWEIINDALPYIGYSDDVIVIITAFIGWLKLVHLFRRRMGGKK